MLTFVSFSAVSFRAIRFRRLSQCLSGKWAGKPGKFTETVELRIALKNYGPRKDKRFCRTVRYGYLLNDFRHRTVIDLLLLYTEIGKHSRVVCANFFVSFQLSSVSQHSVRCVNAVLEKSKGKPRNFKETAVLSTAVGNHECLFFSKVRSIMEMLSINHDVC